MIGKRENPKKSENSLPLSDGIHPVVISFVNFLKISVTRGGILLPGAVLFRLVIGRIN